MRIVLRLLGADLFELVTGPDAAPEPDSVQAVAGSVAADLTPAPAFGLTGHDQPWTVGE